MEYGEDLGEENDVYNIENKHSNKEHEVDIPFESE